jgi:hypothetical protein
MGRWKSWLSGWALVAVLLVASRAGAQQFKPIGGNVQERANAALTLMTFTVVPDAAASTVTINNQTTQNPDLTLWQLGYGMSLSEKFPLYVEGFFGYDRYDPKFVATNGTQQRELPAKWTGVAGTLGAGWEFPLWGDFKFVPILNVSLGRVVSDSAAAGRLLEFATGKNPDLNFLDKGRLDAYGVGGSAMLEYFRFRELTALEVTLRYTYLHLQSYGSSSDAVDGSSDAGTLGLWARWRAPTGLTVMRRPLRYVTELSNSTYLGDNRGVLGFNYLTSAGLGLEIDSSAYHSVLTRTRLVGRYVFGHNVSGFSVGLAVTLF